MSKSLSQSLHIVHNASLLGSIVHAAYLFSRSLIIPTIQRPIRFTVRQMKSIHNNMSMYQAYAQERKRAYLGEASLYCFANCQ